MTNVNFNFKIVTARNGINKKILHELVGGWGQYDPNENKVLRMQNFNIETKTKKSQDILKETKKTTTFNWMSFFYSM